MTLYPIPFHPARDYRVMISASDKSRCLAYSPTPVIRERLTLFDPAAPIQFAYFTSYRDVQPHDRKMANIYVLYGRQIT